MEILLKILLVYEKMDQNVFLEKRLFPPKIGEIRQK
jgi:hypothetical protein